MVQIRPGAQGRLLYVYTSEPSTSTVGSSSINSQFHTPSSDVSTPASFHTPLYEAPRESSVAPGTRDPRNSDIIVFKRDKTKPVKPGRMRLELRNEEAPLPELLTTPDFKDLGELPSHELFIRMCQGSNPLNILTYRPFHATDEGNELYQKVAITPSRSDIIQDIRNLPESSIISSLDLQHRYFEHRGINKKKRSPVFEQDARPNSVNRMYSIESGLIKGSSNFFRKSMNLLKQVKFGAGDADVDREKSDGSFVKKHRRILSATSNTSASEKRAKTLGFKTRKKDLKPFGFENDFFTHQVDVHHFTYHAPAKNIFLRYLPLSLQVAFIEMRSFTTGKHMPQNTLLYGSRAALQRHIQPAIGVTGGCILSDVSFQARSGQLSVILGGSGSGKTTLLDAISHRLDPKGHQSGKILIDGLRCTTSTVQRKLAYVIQHDRLLPNLTVQETLTFVAKLTYPYYHQSELLEKVSEVLDELGLMHVKNQKVGDGMIRGISGGERRRLSIACQLIKFTHILLLDEPTTGLDSFNAYNLIVTLRSLSRKNIVVIATIHQPRSELFRFFDMITIMSAGHVVYHGDRNTLIPYFTGLGYPCPEFQNPLDHYIDVASVDRYCKERQAISEQKVKTLIQHYRRSDLYQDLMGQLGLRDSGLAKWSDGNTVCDSLYKLGILTHRMNVNVIRSVRAWGMRAFVGLMFSLMLFSFMLRLKKDQASMQNRVGLLFQIANGPTYFGIMNAVDLFPTLRDLGYRECMDGLYKPGLFILAYYLHVIPFTAATTVLFGVLGYWGIGFFPDVIRFLYFIGVFFILMIQGESIAVMILGLVSDPVLANGVVSLTMSLSITVGSGFIRNFQSLHPIFELLSYGSMHRYASSVLAANEFSNLTLTCSAGEYCMYEEGEEYLNSTFPDAEEHKGENFSILTGYGGLLVVLCHVVYSIIRIPRLR